MSTPKSHTTRYLGTRATKDKLKPIAIARAVVHRANGATEVHYSYERIPIWDFFRWLKQRKHLAFMREEDRKAGYSS